MGSKQSKPSRKDAKGKKATKKNTGSMAIGAPQDVMIHVPRNRLDKYGKPVQQVTRDIDRNTMSAALKHVSDYIASRRQHVTVVGVGGAVNILHLRSRATTHDVDVFGSDFSNQARLLLDEAMHSAQMAFQGLGTDWLNTETQMWMPGPMHRQLTEASKKQNIVVFNGAGLTIYAAPWEYAFSAKVSRMMKGGDQVRSYDLADAVTYIHQYILIHGNRPVPVATVLGWARQYNHESDEQFLRRRVDAEYQKLHHGRRAIV